MNGPRLLAESVSRRFGSGAAEVVAVRDVSLAVDPGEVVLVMGPSGSGKTTLLLMLGALLRPSSGSIVIDGTDITALRERALPEIRLRHLGFVFQDFNLLSALTVHDNVAVVAAMTGRSYHAAREAAREILGELGLDRRLDFLPEKLSGGEKQRVAIARALVNQPALILADEPTANLDSRIGHEVARRLRTIARERGPSVIVVSHDQRLREHADRVLWLEDGSLKEMSALAVDPVCAMSVERDRAVPGEWRGTVLYFCSRGCRAEFMSDPEHFMAPPAVPQAGVGAS